MGAIGILLDPKRFAVHDGPGIRTTFFLKGCPLKCLWCHNPESISGKPQLAYYQHKCIRCGECVCACRNQAHDMRDGEHVFHADRCIACGKCDPGCLGSALKLYGRRMSVEEALELALEDQTFYQESGGGVTLSGGEPLMQPEFALEFLAQLKSGGINTALDTCCCVSQDVLAKTLPLVDLYLVDFKHADSEIHAELTGRRNEKIIGNLRFLSENGARIEIRIPFVPGCNDSDENMNATGKILAPLAGIQCVRLLPYHALARTKYSALGMADTMPHVEPPSDEQLEHAGSILRKYSLTVRSGRE